MGRPTLEVPEGVIEPMDETYNTPAFRWCSFFWLFRMNRSPMVAMITGTAAFAAGAGVTRALWMTLVGWCLAVGGFSLDFYADRHLDRVGPRVRLRHNPLADGTLPPAAGLTFSITFVAISLALMVWVAPEVWPFWMAILAVILGLAVHCFETPLARALTLGLLQALYMLMGGKAGMLSPAIWLLAGMFFFAMFGGRGMIDIRDFSQDSVTGVQTLPRRYGLRWTARFTAVCLTIAYALSLIAYFTGAFNVLYLYLDLLFIFSGLVCAGFFAVHPTPELAHALTIVFMVGQGTLISLAIVLGSL